MSQKRKERHRSHRTLFRLVGLLGGAALLIGVTVLIFWAQKSEPSQWRVQPVTIDLNSSSDIVLIDQSPIRPLLYHGSLSLSDVTVIDDRKAHFISLLLPAILIAKENQALKRERLEKILSQPEKSSTDRLWVQKMKERYRAEDIATLQRRLHTHPPSLVLAQAALESGWGTSRFFSEANNIFGVWSFNPNEPRIRAQGSRNGQAIYLRQYETVLDSIEDYYRTLATSRSFTQFRHQRLDSRDPLYLVTFLGHYSEQREEYIRKVQSVIRFNDLQQYDSYELDPEYYQWSSY